MLKDPARKHIDGRFTRARVKRVLMVETTRFGDLVATFPVIRRFRCAFPGAAITLVTLPAHLPLFTAIDAGVDIMGFPWPEDPCGCIGTLLDLHERQFDISCGMSPSRKNSLIASFAPARVRAGYDATSRSLRPFRNSHTIRYHGIPKPPQHIPPGTSLYDRAAAIADALGIARIQEAAIGLGADAAHRWESLARSLGLDPSRQIIVIHPFSASPLRAWPAANLAEFLDLLRSRSTLQPVVIGLPHEFSVPYASAVTTATRFASGDWGATAILLAHAAVFIGTDSGPIHLAAALGRPVIGLFGPTAPGHVAPPTGTHIYHQLDCSPCDQKACILQDHSCMAQISPRQVLDALPDHIHSTSAVVAHV
jgi:heptosyltransferase-3